MADNYGRLVLRLGVGGLMLFRGVHALLTGLDPIKQLLIQHKLPDALAYIAYAGEIVGPLLIVIGLFARIGALLVAADVAALALLGGLAHITALSAGGAYGLEADALYLAGALAILFLGPGKIAVGKGKYQ
jgi:putative oxidoreductase